MTAEHKVGIRELRQNLSVYIERVKAGETLEVTEHGKPVAALGPLPESANSLDRLVAEGRAWPSESSPSELGPPIKVEDPDISRRVREALDAEREDKI